MFRGFSQRVSRVLFLGVPKCVLETSAMCSGAFPGSLQQSSAMSLQRETHQISDVAATGREGYIRQSSEL